MIERLKDTALVEHIFDGWDETLIWSCLQGVMGKIYVDNTNSPMSAMAMLGDFCFFAGSPNKELVLYKPDECRQDFIIMIPQDEKWAKLIEKNYDIKAKKVSRYAIKKEFDIFEKDKLLQIVGTLPQEYTIKLIDKDIFYRCKEIDWCKDWVSQYTDYEKYHKYGLGVVILKDGELISGASAYSSYNDGIEIEIDTNEKYRRKGFAYICGAKLILECLDRNLYPSWDAQNKWSVALAEKLGYHYNYTYTAYEIYEY